MPSPLHDLLADGMAMLAEIAGEKVTYRRRQPGGDWTARVKTWPAQFAQAVDVAGELRLEQADMDFAVLPGELGLTPEPGDLIERDIGAGTDVYEVMPLSDQQCSRLDGNEVRLLIHTKRINKNRT